MSSAVSWFLFLLFVSAIISHFAVCVNMFLYDWISEKERREASLVC